MAGRPRKTTDGMSITGEEPETTESQTETAEDSSTEQTYSPTEVPAGGKYVGYHSDVILEGGAYQINDGLLGHKIRVEYIADDYVKEIFNQTSTDETGLNDEAIRAVRHHKAENFPATEEAFDIG